MLEAEATFVSSLDEVMDLAEDMIRSVTQGLNDSTIGTEVLRGQRREGEEEIDLEGRWRGILEGPWPRITYTQAIDALVASGEKFEHAPVWGAGLQAEHERFLAREVGKGGPVFVSKYPTDIKPFYMLPSSASEAGESRQTVDCFDLLLPDVCEVAGGSLREHSLEPLRTAMRKHGVAEEGMEWYVDLRRWGSVPHGGFGVGFDRLLAYLGGVGNIREVVAFPRWVGRCEC